MTLPYTVGALLVSDSFNRSNGAIGSTDGGSLGSLAWQVDGGASLSSFAVSSSRCATVGSASSQAAWVDVGTPNMRVEITVSSLLTFGGNIGVVFRYLTRSDGFWLGCDATSGQKLYAQYYPTLSNVASAIATCSAGDTIMVDAYRERVWVWKNGTLLHSDAGLYIGGVTDAHMSSTKAGLWANNNSGSGALDNFKVWELISAERCSEFEGLITDVVASSNISLSVASSAFPDALSNYRISFFDDTTSGTTPASSLLSAGPWTIGPMTDGQHIRYAIRRLDGAHIDGSCVMRATDTAFGLTWDVTVQCPANPWGYNLSFGQRSGL